ncbi:MAG TPA: DNA polymerase IV, partial [Caulobacteraceae bacterium]|nr:DNA polymerase IV [Caulobacteraceae bacterium]
AIVIKPDFAKYTTASRTIKSMFEELTPLVQPLSLDEAWPDLSGTERLNGGPAAWQLAKVQARVEREVGITVSIGLAPNKFLAKIASDLDKPKGFAVIGSEAQAFLADKPVGILPGVGPAFVASLEKRGYRKVGDLARAEPRDLVDQFGEYGLRLHQLAHGRDSRPVNPSAERKSISAENTFFEDIRAIGELEDELWPLCEKVGRRARASGLVGQVATLKLKTTDFRIVTRRRTLPVPTQTAKTLFGVMRELLREEARGEPYRLIGAGLSEMLEAGTASDLFADAETRALKGEQAIDALRAKFGAGAVVSGRALKSGR